MKIAQSSVAMSGTSSSVRTETVTQKVYTWQTAAAATPSAVEQSQSAAEQQGGGQGAATPQQDEHERSTVSISDEGKKLMAANQVTTNWGSVSNSRFDFQKSLIERMLEVWTGKKTSFRSVRFNPHAQQQQHQRMHDQLSKLSHLQQRQIVSAPVTGNFAINVEREVSFEQSMSFHASANVRTEDGRDISIELELNLHSSFTSKTTASLVASRLCDPLVINYAAPSALLGGEKFSFDIDADGQADQISRLMSGSGYLALDHNEDGIVNDGSELFGTSSGDGFADLAKYDTDGNNWIDENDEIFDKLRIWYNDEQGNSHLVGLGEMGVGAIYLGSVGSVFELGEGLDAYGQIQKTGFFLRENGTAGTVQHVDLVV